MDLDKSDWVEWHPARLLQEQSGTASTEKMTTALIILNQPITNISVLQRLWGNSEINESLGFLREYRLLILAASLHVAADGGANWLYKAKSRVEGGWINDLDAIIGDLDSIQQNVREYYESPARPTKVVYSPSQYSTDFAKAVEYVRAAHAGPRAVDIVAMGGLGGRVDQGVSQLHHLYLFQKDPHYADGRLYLLSETGLTFLLIAGRHRIRVRDEKGPDGQREHADVFDKYVGILPIGRTSFITTKGLEWDITDWKTEFGGQMSTSNHILSETDIVEVKTTADVLFTVALKAVDAEQN